MWLGGSSSALGQAVPYVWEITGLSVFDEQGEAYSRPFLGGFNVPRPQLVDIDDDGDLDLFVQEKSNQVIFFEHDASQNGFPFIWRTAHYEGIDVGEWYRFADIDLDGDQDLLTESPFSLLKYYQNVGTTTNPQFELAADTLFDNQGAPVFADRQNILNVTDIDCDGLPDLFVGRNEGTIRRYEVESYNQGIPIFVLLDDRFQDIEIIGEVGGKREGESRHGANTLAFVDIDMDGDQDLFWGDFFEPGILFFENSGTCTEPQFSQDGVSFPTNAPLNSSGYNAPTFGDVDGDGVIDLLVGVLGGAFSASSSSADNLYYYKGTTGFEMVQDSRRFLSNLDFGSDSLPALEDLDRDGDLDLVVTNSIDPGNQEQAKAFLFENRGDTRSPEYHEVGVLTLYPGFNYAPTYGDLDGDGMSDMLVGTWRGPIDYYKKNSDTLADFELLESEYLDIPNGGNSTPFLVDIDGDEDLDIIAGDARGTLNYFENVGSPTVPSFASPIDNWMDIDVGRRSRPVFLDIDGDNDQDMIVGTDQEGIKFFRNTGDVNTPLFQLEENILELPVLRRMTPAFADLDDDGDKDLLMGTLDGGLLYFQNEAGPVSIEPDTPLSGFQVSSYPNPVANNFNVEVEVETQDYLTVRLYDVLGRTAVSIFEGRVLSGKTVLPVEMNRLPPGLYFIKVTGAHSPPAIIKVIKSTSY